ncbi:MAG: beta-lactamase family protein [Clostridia bacterium]|nr:beta-lactamase family protein [Clostridia bacterium]
MKNWGLYRLLVRFLPARGSAVPSDLPARDRDAVEAILRRFRCVGATVCLFDAAGVTGTLSFGVSHLPSVPARADTVYRAASVSKFVAALGAMKLKEQGKIDLDADVNFYLPFSLRHPQAPDTPITLRMLMSHTAGIHDGNAYNAGIAQGIPLQTILQGDSFTAHLPNTLWEYSNLGAGIAGAVMEAAAGVDFEQLMQETVFAPLQVQATFYPQNVRGDLADAIRILPRQKSPNFNAAQRRARPLPPKEINAEKHYNLAHGNLCVSAPDLARLGVAGMIPGFLSEESLREMRRAVVPFGERAHNLSQGLFTFILQDSQIAPRPLYGHQGMAYGAVHGLFFDPEEQRGLAVLTTGASEARRGVLADLNAALLQKFLGENDG